MDLMLDFVLNFEKTKPGFALISKRFTNDYKLSNFWKLIVFALFLYFLHKIYFFCEVAEFET